MIPGAPASVLPDDDGGVPSVAPAMGASRELREGLQEIYKSAQDARHFNYHGGAPAKAARVESSHDVGSAPAAALSAVPSRLAEPTVGGKVCTWCPLCFAALRQYCDTHCVLAPRAVLSQ